MKNYVALHKKTDAKIYFSYQYGVLQKIELFELAKEEQVQWAIKRAYNLATESEMWKAIENRSLDFQYMEVPQDLRFEVFWNHYGYKVGKIPPTQKAWNKLTDAEKIEALLYIPRLREKKRIDNTSMPYPSTYLNGKYWMADKI